MSTAAVRIMIVEDSAFMRDELLMILEEDDAMTVVATASTGRQALTLLETQSPDVILMDIHMPGGVSGFEAIDWIMASKPTPILVMTGDRRDEIATRARRQGALEVFTKTDNLFQDAAQQEALRARIRFLAQVPVVRHMKHAVQGYLAPSPALSRDVRGVVVASHGRLPLEGGSRSSIHALGVVASTGGPEAVAQLLRHLSDELPFSIVIVQHLTAGFDRKYAMWLQGYSRLSVTIARPGSALRAGEIVVAPTHAQLRIDARGCVQLSACTDDDFGCPSGDVLLSDLARVFGARAAGVVLTGMGSDGARGLFEIQERGGLTFAQSENTCAVFGMPSSAIGAGAVPAHHVLAPEDIAQAINRIAVGQQSDQEAEG